jgi:hypothetical protein
MLLPLSFQRGYGIWGRCRISQARNSIPGLLLSGLQITLQRLLKVDGGAVVRSAAILDLSLLNPFKLTMLVSVKFAEQKNKER